jgi:hypothetical protein
MSTFTTRFFLNLITKSFTHIAKIFLLLAWWHKQISRNSSHNILQDLHLLLWIINITEIKSFNFTVVSLNYLILLISLIVTLFYYGSTLRFQFLFLLFFLFIFIWTFYGDYLLFFLLIHLLKDLLLLFGFNLNVVWLQLIIFLD